MLKRTCASAKDQLQSPSEQDEYKVRGPDQSSTMQQIADWLQNIGLGQYAQRFAENDITFAILPHLTDQDLKELGVTSLGHRRQLLLAIAEISNGQKDPAPPPSAAAPHDIAERRQVTVMFSDLVGSTALSARMDPEDLREVISAYQKCVAETVRRFGGFVANYMGDGVLVYFGYPEAHEDDAERAVRAGLELIAAVAALKTSAPLQTRVGISTGLVVVGDLIGPGSAKENAIIGETPNLAARLQGIAEPNTVIIAAGTRKLLGTLFELEDLGPKDLKGIAGPVYTWAVLRPSNVEGRFEALHASRLTALVGRNEEIELLLRRWSRAKAGEGQVVLLSGEAGIGKSRLTAVLLERLATEPHTRLRYFCSPQHTDSALYPVIRQMERAAGFAHDDKTQARLDKLDALLAQTSTSAHDAALFAEMLSLPNDGRYPSLDELTSEQRRQRTLEALTTYMQALSRQNPVLMILEDVHWTDPTSLEAFGRAVDRLRTMRVLLIVTFRPEFEPPWIGRSHLTALSLNRLGEREIGAMIDGVAGNKPLPANIRLDIVERTDGIPLFIEEMTKAVLEAKSEGDAWQTAAAVPASALAVPASLRASLMARLDRLGPAKEVAQIGAAIGREFSHALLAAAASKPQAELALALDQLVQSGLLFRQGMPPHASYLFKHALVQDTAYSTLLREPRRALHARIADVLEDQFPEIAESQPELLARHCTEAGLIEKAAGLWRKAGQQSLTRSALVEAATQFARSLAQIAALPITAALRRAQIEALVGLGKALVDTAGQAAPETKSAWLQARDLMKQAEELGEALDDPLLQSSVLLGLWRSAYVAFDGDLMRELAAEFLAFAEKQRTTVPLTAAYRCIGLSLLLTGDIAAGRARLDQTIALYDPADRPQATRLGQDARVVALSFRAFALWLLGYPEAALRDADGALKDAREIGQATTLMLALAIPNITYILCGDCVAVNAFANELITLAAEKGAPLRKAEAIFQQGCALALTGRTADAVETIASGVRAWRSTGATCWTPLHMLFLADAHARIGQFDDARRCIGEAMAASQASKESCCDAEVHRVAGEIALMGPQPDASKAEAHFARALAVARAQQAKSWELRAAMSMARLWRAQGKVQQARELLASVYGWFTEGFDTRDLKDAKALLDTLAA
jgi:class 3 adenylate cyclase/predicted ATPase